jgi:CHC2-type zinc finger protein/DNA primase RepB-like protein
MSGGLEAYLNCLYGAEPRGAYVELRGKRPGGGMDQTFIEVGEVERIATVIRRVGAKTDLYVGVCPRSRREGTRAAVENAHVLWVDADTPESIEALRAFRPRPSLVIGSGHGLHAYWSLVEPIGPDEVEQANRKLAHRLRADARATDAARILRPPGTFNFKGQRPLAVKLRHVEVEVFTAAELTWDLPDPPDARSGPARREPRPLPQADGVDDALLSIAPAVYVEALTDQAVGRDGKIVCPFHDDRTPSCHVYDDPERGWYCFGCGKGGTIYDFAAELWKLDTRGEDFKLLRRRISERLLNTAVAA